MTLTEERLRAEDPDGRRRRREPETNGLVRPLLLRLRRNLLRHRVRRPGVNLIKLLIP
jgi:hypothetical protein